MLAEESASGQVVWQDRVALVVFEQGLSMEQRFGHFQFSGVVLSSLIIFLQPLQDTHGWFLFDACFHQTLGHSILLMLNEEISQSQELIIINRLCFSRCLVNTPKR